MSIYTEYLNRLAKFSADIDCAAVTNSGFCELQKLEAAILEAEHKGYYTNKERRMLCAIAIDLHNKYRDAIALNERVKQIEKEIRRGRRKTA